MEKESFIKQILLNLWKDPTDVFEQENLLVYYYTAHTKMSLNNLQNGLNKSIEKALEVEYYEFLDCIKQFYEIISLVEEPRINLYFEYAE